MARDGQGYPRRRRDMMMIYIYIYISMYVPHIYDLYTNKQDLVGNKQQG